MIHEVTMTDFRAFQGTVRLPLRPITVLVGENNSGKSSLLSAIRLMAQTLQNPDVTVPLLFDGPFGDFGAFRDVVHGHHRGRPFSLGLVTSQRYGTEPALHAALLAEFKYRQQRRETIVRSSRLLLGGTQLLAVTASGDDRHVLSQIGRSVVPPAVRSQFSRDFRMQNFIPRPLAGSFRYARTDSSPDVQRFERKFEQVRRIAQESARSLAGVLEQVEVLSSDRDPLLRTFVHSGSVSRRIGAHGENWANLIAAGGAAKSRDRVVRDLSDWARSAGIAAGLEVRWLSDRHFELYVQHPLSLEWSNVVDVGRGTSQVIPVILGGLRLRPNSTYLVEEPEIHLHPRAQAALGDYFVDLAARGVQSLIETHSEYLILRLQQHVAAGRLSANDVVFYYVEASRQGKKVRQLTLNRDAVFSKGLPKGFFPERLIEANKLVAARSGQRDG
jgi:hypothetical protein